MHIESFGSVAAWLAVTAIIFALTATVVATIRFSQVCGQSILFGSLFAVLGLFGIFSAIPFLFAAKSGNYPIVYLPIIVGTIVVAVRCKMIAPD